MKNGFRFDWKAYRPKIGNTPIEKAVTMMLAEYAALYSRVAGQTGTACPPPMTLKEAESISE